MSFAGSYGCPTATNGAQKYGWRYAVTGEWTIESFASRRARTGLPFSMAA